MSLLRLGLVALVTLLLPGVLPAADAAGPASCLRSVSGGNTEETAAVERILCLMPGTAIRSVEIRTDVVDAGPRAVWLAISIRAFKGSAGLDALGYTRAKWEADIAAAAIRDGFVRLGLRHVVAYQDLTAGRQPHPAHLYGIARPEWKVARWSTGADPKSLGVGVQSWSGLQARLDALSRRFHVRTQLTRYNPFGKAPVVTIRTAQGGRFIDAGGFQAYERAVKFAGARYDGALIQLLTPSHAGLQVFVVDRGRRSSGCSRLGVIPHLRYEICPSD
ncbi:MAG: hypothetical protein QOK13_379 [Gaiellaceae bacterium]|nr:hypothetical protein [Gaiellaceae bacterium]